MMTVWIELVEAWGTGPQRIQNAAREYSLPDPEFIEMPELLPKTQRSWAQEHL